MKYSRRDFIKTTAAAVLEEVKSRQALSSRLIKDRRQWVHEYNARRRAELQKTLEKEAPTSAEIKAKLAALRGARK